MKTLFAGLLLLAWPLALPAQEQSNRPSTFSSPTDCFTALQTAVTSAPPDYRTLLACHSPAMANAQVGRVACQLVYGAYGGDFPRKSIDAHLSQHGLPGIDIHAVHQLMYVTKNQTRPEYCYHQLGSKVKDQAGFLEQSAAWIAADAPKPGRALPASKLTLANLTIDGDAAWGDAVDDAGRIDRRVCFRRAAGSWVFSLPVIEPAVEIFTPAEREALAKLSSYGYPSHLRMSDDFTYRLEQWQFNVRGADENNLAPLRQLPTFRSLMFMRVALTDSGLRHLDTQQDLQALSIAGTQVTDAGVLSLSCHKRLKFLDLTNLDISPDTIKQLQTKLPECEIKHVWEFDAVAALPGTFRDLGAKRPAILLIGDSLGDERVRKWLEKLNTREIVQFAHPRQISGVIDWSGDLRELPHIDRHKSPQFLLLQPGAKPIELPESGDSAELLAAIRKGLP